MGLTHLSVKGDVNVRLDGKDVVIAKSDVAKRAKTQLELQSEVTTKTETATRPIHAHKNRDGTIAVAVGAPPERWPEDEE